jgi:chemotaxis protein methyltransferase CheR
VLCRNVAFTYFDERMRRDFAERAAAILVDGGLLVVGRGEAAPLRELTLVAPLIYERAARGIPASVE